MRAKWWLGVLFLLGMAGGCHSETPESGSESHFLTACNASCGSGFECLCGVCTQRCNDDATCTPLYSGAACVALSDRGAGASCASDAAAFCDVRCGGDADCRGLGADFTCNAGFCRQVPSSTLGSNGRIELSQVCDFYVQDTCRAKLNCYGWDYQSVEACMQAQECDGLAELQAELAAQAVVYDPVATFACHRRFLADACTFGPILFSVPNLPLALEFCGALSGTLDVGAACDGNGCKAGLKCDTSASCPGVCAVPPPDDDLPAGASCLPEICIPAQDHCSQCAVGLDCVNQVCVPTPKVGDTCTGSLGCGDALWCNPATSLCAPLAKAGEACSDFRKNAANCQNDLWCDDTTIGTGTGVCRTLSAAGESCLQDVDCQKPLSCVPNGPYMPRVHGACAGLQPLGAFCDSFADCTSNRCDGTTSLCVPQPAAGEACIDSCAQGLTCVSSVCLIKRYAGEPCDATTQCENSRCENAVCTNRAHFGAACATNDDCQSNHCSAALCIDPVGCAEQ